ncbi:hypothetical protein [Kocuria atrinae]|uniref:hypothetical protein n=1 Tax=Kocuria atrinae TaxID=592377 RepID=UPI00031E6409|nr:hypothetical protein [Kocuria atrinae]
MHLSQLARRVLVGKPLHNERAGGTLLRNRAALPVFASDALSSVAYAPDEIVLTLALAGTAAIAISPWVGIVVLVVLIVLITAYRQNVRAYPSGGADFEIASKNLGRPSGAWWARRCWWTTPWSWRSPCPPQPNMSPPRCRGSWVIKRGWL